MKSSRRPRWQLALLWVAGLAAGSGAALFYGDNRWRRKTTALRRNLHNAQQRIAPPIDSDAAIDKLPLPVQRYFRAALPAHPRRVLAARFAHQGSFRLSPSRPGWQTFRSTQTITTSPPGFVWEGRIAMGAGLTVCVQDAYVGGTGLLRAELCGLIPLAQTQNTPEIARGELMRYLAEAAWYPTALLPGQGVEWEAIDDQHARARLTDGEVTVALEYKFDEAGMITEIYAPARDRMIQGAFVPTPWRGRFWEYQKREGMQIPVEGEVGWELPDGYYPYWRGLLTDIAFEFGS